MGKKKHVVNVMFTVLLLGVFALSVVFVSVLGAEVYQSSAAKMQANFDTRTSLVYIAEKVRQSASTNFDVRELDGDQSSDLDGDLSDDPDGDLSGVPGADQSDDLDGDLSDDPGDGSDGNPALVITEKYDDKETYETWIYVWGGKLYETTIRQGDEIQPGGGQAIMDMKSMDFKVDGELVRITSVNDAGDEESLTIGRRS
jgi:hypothetical protein